VAIVDTGSGNLRSVEKALVAAGAAATVTADPDAVARADKIVVPGQGAFGGCVAGLERQGGALKAAVLDSVARGTPYFGVCLGLQILFEGSAEDPACRGLALLPGRVVRFGAAGPAAGVGPAAGAASAADAPRIKIPHMGWNACAPGPAAARTPVLREVLRDPAGGDAAGAVGEAGGNSWFYFVHSYYAAPADSRDVALTAEHGVRFCAAVARDNLFACQFHPEKSQRAGLALLARFVAG
jgi:glutamine amidotransferase